MMHINRRFVCTAAMPIMMLASACTQTTKPVVMVHAETGEERVCGPYFIQNNFDGVWQSHEASAIAQERQCIADYKEQGFVRK